MNQLGSFSRISVRTAKVQTAGAYLVKTGSKRTGNLTAGAFHAEGEKVKRGEIVWNQNNVFNTGWGCIPGKQATERSNTTHDLFLQERMWRSC